MEFAGTLNSWRLLIMCFSGHWTVPIDQLLKKVASELQELQNYEEVDNTKTTKIQFLARQLQRNFPPVPFIIAASTGQCYLHT